MKAKKAARGIYSVIDPENPWKLPRLDWEYPEYFYTSTATKWMALLQKASQGDAEAEYFVAVHYSYGCKDPRGRILVRVSNRKAAEWYRRSAEHGNLMGKLALGVILGGNHGVKKDVREAMLWLRRAVRDEATSSAANNIAVTYRQIGKLGQAVRWFREAVALGDDGDRVQLGIHSYWGKGVRTDHAAAVRCFRRAVSGKNMAEFERDDAFFFLGIAYLEGNGVKKSLSIARKHLERANKDNDHLAAQRLLRQMDRGV